MRTWEGRIARDTMAPRLLGYFYVFVQRIQVQGETTWFVYG